MRTTLSPELQEKLSHLSPREPYVWRLRLSESDFQELEAAVQTCAKGQGVAALCTGEHALLTVAYIAEWYKRRYQGGCKNDLIDGIDLETLWQNSGISRKRFLYRDASGQERRLYSLYVLGGLAVEHELGRGDGMRFLKALCRIYHGENPTLENLDQATRATAFRESIRCQHSLFEYLKELLSGNLPFAQDDLQDATSSVNRFAAVVQLANKEVMRQKFRLEWIVNFSPGQNAMSRMLRLWFKPEDMGGLHQYLRFDRLHIWGIPHPERLLHLYIYIRFRNGDAALPCDDKPVVTYLNHSVNDFVAFGAERCATLKHVTTQPFTHIDIVVQDDEGNEYTAQTLEAAEYLQLWCTDPYSDLWSSTQSAQHETALVFSRRCRLHRESQQLEVYSQSFRDNVYGESDLWNWVYIYDSVTFYDHQGKEQTLYNRNGYDQTTTHLYLDTIRYVDGGNIRHCQMEEAWSEDPTTDHLPLIFGREDIVVHHFDSKDDIKNARPTEDSAPDSVEYKQPNGHYREWTDTDQPAYGMVTLRITVKAKASLLNAVYLPRLSETTPIARDYVECSLRYRAINGSEQLLQDQIPKDGTPLTPTLTLKYGSDTDWYEVDVYRPTLIKEIMIDGCIVEYEEGDDTEVHLPYILKDRTRVNDFSRKGYQSYPCSMLGNIYTDDFLHIAGNKNAGRAALAAWTGDKHYKAQMLDPTAPDSLWLCFGTAPDSQQWEGTTMLAWNYDKDREPTVIASPDETPDFGVVIQDLSQPTSLTCNYPIQNDDDPWEWDEIETDPVRCFDLARRAQTYFFLMRPIADMDVGDMNAQLLQPLIKARNATLTIADRKALRRLAQEMGFDWSQQGVDIDNI